MAVEAQPERRRFALVAHDAARLQDRGDFGERRRLRRDRQTQEKPEREPHLPAEILYRPKMGFGVPLAQWFRGPLREPVRRAVLGPVLAETGWFNASYLRRLVDDHQSGRRDYSTPLWTLLMFESFLRNVMGAQATRAARAVGD